MHCSWLGVSDGAWLHPPRLTDLLAIADIRGQGAEDGGPDVRWTIDNKYYSADVGFRILDQQEVYEDGEEPVVIVLAARDKVSWCALGVRPRLALTLDIAASQ